MRKVTVIAKTKEEAIEQGLTQLRTTLHRVKVNIIEEEKKGILFGLGSKEAKIEMEIIENPQLEAIELLENVFSALKLDFSVQTQESDEGTVLNIVGDELGMIIGRRGQTLDSLQYLLNIIANRYSEQPVRFILDAENFRERRKKTLQQLSTRIAQQVIKSRKSVTLEPMSSLDRKIIHMHLQDHSKVKTISDGEEPNRHIIISLK
jgi:spoIIIJ-associated protein